jgi:hypothetical protein
LPANDSAGVGPNYRVKKAEGRIGFAIGPYDTERPLVIDPANGAPCTFTVDVSDNGEPGATDAFSISLSGGATEGGTLRSGNIQIH